MDLLKNEYGETDGGRHNNEAASSIRRLLTLGRYTQVLLFDFVWGLSGKKQDFHQFRNGRMFHIIK